MVHADRGANRGGSQMLYRGVTLSEDMRQERGVAWMSSVFVTG